MYILHKITFSSNIVTKVECRRIHRIIHKVINIYTYTDNSTRDPKLYAIFPTQVFVTQKCKHRLSLVQNLIQNLMFFSMSNGI